jgi:hypothetical protein
MSFSEKNSNFAHMIREAIIQKLTDRKISIRKCAIDNDFNYQDFYRFIKGYRPYPLEKIERVISYLDLEIK